LGGGNFTGDYTAFPFAIYLPRLYSSGQNRRHEPLIDEDTFEIANEKIAIWIFLSLPVTLAFIKLD
jgi:hypothetical protein